MFTIMNHKRDRFLKGINEPRFTKSPRIFYSIEEINDYEELLFDAGCTCTGPTNKFHETVHNEGYVVVELLSGNILKTIPPLPMDEDGI